MTHADLVSLWPELILSGGGVLILLLDAVAPGLRRAWTAVALATTAAAAWGAAAAFASLGGGTAQAPGERLCPCRGGQLDEELSQQRAHCG